MNFFPVSFKELLISVDPLHYLSVITSIRAADVEGLHVHCGAYYAGAG
jgi:hypothetical protein